MAARRRAEELILAGRVRVKGRVVTELGTKADARADRIEVDGKRIVPERPVYLVLHKPRGVVSTLRDPEGRRTVASLVSQVKARLVPVGRLDYATSGVLLLTNDGDFVKGLSHPGKEVEKVYRAKVKGIVDESVLARWQRPIRIDGVATRPAKVRLLGTEKDKSWLEIRLTEGKNRQIRRLGEAVGSLVQRLARTEFAGITVEDLPVGHFRSLTVEELRALQKRYGVPRKVRAAANVPREPGSGERRIGQVSDPGKRRPVTRRGPRSKAKVRRRR